ncbi:MAG: PilW family protein [Aquabacterium sp.]
MSADRSSSLRSSQRGLSLIELMVAMVIGLVVVGAGASAYFSVSTNSRNATAMARMTEDASIALNILRAHIAMAGYSHPTGKETVTETLPDRTERTRDIMTRAFKGGTTASGDPNQFIAGCDGPFADRKSKELNIAELACDDKKAGDPDSLAVVYEAEPDVTYTDSAGNATDCLSNAVPEQKHLSDPTLKIASNKFYIDKDTTTGVAGLYCQGNGRNDAPDGTDTLPATLSPQMIVENVIGMDIRYGVGAAGPRPDTPVAQSYLTATDLRKLAGTERWSRVVSVRLCLTVRSPPTIRVSASEQPSYVACDGTVQANNTGGFVRTFTSTIVLQNRIGTLNTHGT